MTKNSNRYFTVKLRTKIYVVEFPFTANLVSFKTAVTYLSNLLYRRRGMRAYSGSRKAMICTRLCVHIKIYLYFLRQYHSNANNHNNICGKCFLINFPVKCLFEISNLIYARTRIRYLLFKFFFFVVELKFKFECHFCRLRFPGQHLSTGISLW
jgi:hypothetical protein